MPVVTRGASPISFRKHALAVALTLLGAFPMAAATAQESSKPTGQYFGKFNLTMNTPFNSGAPYLWRIKSTWPVDGSAWTYGTLGWGEGTQQYWLWDFDSNVVKL